MLWTESLKYVAPDDLDYKITSALNIEFEKLLADYPDELRVLIGETYWQIQAGDHFFRKIRKRYQPIKITVSTAYHNLINKYNDLRHKPPTQIKPV